MSTTANYDGICADCRGKIHEGDDISYSDEAGGWVCEDCVYD